MSELPRSWARASLGDIADEPEQHIPAADDSFAYIDISAIDRMRKAIQNAQQMLGKDAPSRARKKIAAGDTLVSMTRPNLNAVALVPDSLEGQIASTGFDVLRPRTGVDPRWLAYIVRTDDFVKTMSDLVQGALYPAVRSKDVRGYIAPLAPTGEQTRIANQLDTLLGRIQACQDRLDAIPALLKRFRQAVLNSAASGKLIDSSQGGGEPTVQSTVVGAIALDLRYGTSKKCTYARTGHGVLRIPNIAPHGRIDLADLKCAVFETREIEKLILQEGDLLVIRSNGSLDLVGACSVVTTRESGLLFAGYLMRLRVDRSKVHPEYVRICLAASKQRELIERAAKSTSGVNNLNAEELRSLPLLLPSMDEQEAIVNRVATLFEMADRIEVRYCEAKQYAQRLTPLTLTKAFRGELVQQDPNDEPASVLLQRLATTSAVAVKAPRGRPRSKHANPANPLPTAHPDWAALPAGAWAANAQPDEHTTAALLIAVLKAWGQPMPQDQARLAAMLCLQPRLFTAALPARDASLWRRLVGPEAEPLPASVAGLQPAVNALWRRALAGLRARGDMVASGSGPQDTWALGPGADRVDTASWPDGRAGWVVAYLRAHGAEAVLPLLPTAAVDFVHARAA